MMKKLLPLVACLAFSTAASAEKYDATVQLALSEIDIFKDGMSLVGKIGKAMPDVHPNFSAEGELSLSMTNPTYSVPFANIDVEASYLTLGGYGVYNHEVSPETTVKGRAGLVYIDTEVEFVDPFFGTKTTVSDSSFELAYGFGADFQLKGGTVLVFEYTVIDELTHIAGGIKFDLNM